MDYTIHGLLQARILEWVAFPSPGDLPNLGIEPRPPTLQADSYQLSHKGSPCAKPLATTSLLFCLYDIAYSGRLM